MTAEEKFLERLAEAVIVAGGVPQADQQGAHALAWQVLTELRGLEPYAYPNILDVGELRFIYQWDEKPPLVTVMLWDELMWRDMARVEVPSEVL